MKITILAGVFALAHCMAVVEADATPTTFTYTGAIQTFTVPATGEYTITLDGAQGGDSFQRGGGIGGGYGAEVSGDYFLTAGTVLNVVVGGAGGFPSAGGGGSFVYTPLNVLLLAADGGGAGQSASNSGLGGPGLAGTSGGAGTGNA